MKEFFEVVRQRQVMVGVEVEVRRVNQERISFEECRTGGCDTEKSNPNRIDRVLKKIGLIFTFEIPTQSSVLCRILCPL